MSKDGTTDSTLTRFFRVFSTPKAPAALTEDDQLVMIMAELLAQEQAPITEELEFNSENALIVEIDPYLRVNNIIELPYVEDPTQQTKGKESTRP